MDSNNAREMRFPLFSPHSHHLKNIASLPQSYIPSATGMT
jgi:hypothetical protein